METLIKNRTALLHDYWIYWLDNRDWADSRVTSAKHRMDPSAVLLASVWVATAIALIIFFNYQALTAQPDSSDSNTANFYAPQQLTQQQFANQYKDPSLNDFFGQ